MADNSDATTAKADGGSRRFARPGSRRRSGRKPALSFATLKEKAGAGRPEGPTRKAQLRISRVDPWSVMKTSFLFSVVGGIALIIAVWVWWGIISLSGGLNAMQQGITAMVGADSGGGSNLANYVTMWRVLGFTVLVSVVSIVLVTAITTLFSFVYNVAANVIGGLEVTLAED